MGAVLLFLVAKPETQILEARLLPGPLCLVLLFLPFLPCFFLSFVSLFWLFLASWGSPNWVFGLEFWPTICYVRQLYPAIVTSIPLINHNSYP